MDSSLNFPLSGALNGDQGGVTGFGDPNHSIWGTTSQN